MKVVFTEDALRDLGEILRFIGRNYPTISVGNYLIVYEVARDEAIIHYVRHVRVGARGKRNDRAPVRCPATLSAHGRRAQRA
jgi:plasmid stabilization system protein ParE